MKVSVRRGDSLWYYGQLFYIPYELIKDSNSDVDPSSLQIGQELQIPGFTLQRYSVKRGDTFWKLASARNVNVDALLLLNQKQNPNSLPIGERINLPKRVISPIVEGKSAYDFQALRQNIDELKAVYPFVDIKEIGKSVQGLPLYELIIGKGNKKINFNGSFHANEWITTPIVMTFLNDYLLALTNSSNIRGISPLPLYLSTSLSIVPMVNPDGVNLVINGAPSADREKLVKINKGSNDFSKWKANIRGVDLNNQYPAKWELEKERKEEKAPAPRDFPGYKPLSEPESIAMEKLANTRKFDRMLAFHTQGEEFYWGYEGLEPQESEELADDFSRVSGYKSIRYVDSYAGYKDWFIKEFQKAGFTIELGRGINPLPLSQFNEIYQRVLGIMLVTLYK
ncbi:M14 family metallopeptidase [Bacillus sp. 2205SS5-2]|uniref:M14 family metallopeptidase n=1 Tax=Bacillus sp. 2205SS5-2 TaxID=3109031 RepID=UPI003007712B